MPFEKLNKPTDDAGWSKQPKPTGLDWTTIGKPSTSGNTWLDHQHPWNDPSMAGMSWADLGGVGQRWDQQTGKTWIADFLNITWEQLANSGQGDFVKLPKPTDALYTKLPKPTDSGGPAMWGDLGQTWGSKSGLRWGDLVGTGGTWSKISKPTD